MWSTTSPRQHAPSSAAAPTPAVWARRTDTGTQQDEMAADRAADEVQTGALRERLKAARPLPLAAAGSATAAFPGSGTALDEPTRSDMQARFGHDFSRVRIHADAGAGRTADQQGAMAFTHGQHLVFGPGRYAPHTSTGRHLLAHELAHVVQQSQPGAVPRVMGKPKPGKDATPTAPVPAAAPDPVKIASEATKKLRDQAAAFASAKTAPDLDPTLTALRSTFNAALTEVMGDASRAPLVSDLRDAYRLAVDAALRANTKPVGMRDPPTMQSLYETHRDAIEPFALPVATADSSAQSLSAELEAPLPEGATADQKARHAALASARQQMRVITSAVTMEIDAFFDTKGGTTRVDPPSNTQVRFASGVHTSLQRGLTSVGAELMNNGLVPNSTIMLAMDLSAFGGGYDAYRFTRLDYTQAKKPVIELLVELQGAIGVEGLTTNQRTELQRRFAAAGFTRASGFSTDDFDQVLLGVSEIPDATLGSLGALSFARTSVFDEDPAAAAHYDQASHTVFVHDLAYADSRTRHGRAGRVLKFAAVSVVHEIGHALDLNSLRTTGNALTAAEDAILAEFKDTNAKVAPDEENRKLLGRPLEPGADRDRYDELWGTVKTTQKAEAAARSRSGARWHTSATTGNREITDTAVKGDSSEFRKAAAADDGPGSPRMPTNYPNPDSVLQEYYAESFALYQTSPDQLRRIRPKVYAYMAKEFPK
jgi:Domain of unknown function (DUF4157)